MRWIRKTSSGAWLKQVSLATTTVRAHAAQLIHYRRRRWKANCKDRHSSVRYNAPERRVSSLKRVKKDQALRRWKADCVRLD